MWKHIVSNVLTLLIVGLFVAGGVLVWAKGQYEAPGPLAAPVCLKVESGSTMARVSRKLTDMDAVSYGFIFRTGADYTDKTSQLKAGSFLLPARVSMEEIVDIITRGGRSTCGTEVVYRIGVNAVDIQVRELDPETSRFEEIAEFDPAEGGDETYDRVRGEADTRFRIAVAEGVTSWQVVEALKSADFLAGEIAEVPPEGSLAPESYEVIPGDARAEVIEDMTRLQSRRLEEAWANRADDLPIASPEEALILASIVEKETGVPEERGTVAGVFVNRLREGMRLQTDPTVIYGVTKGEGVLGRGLRRSELDTPTPWNTYQIDGLPPTPIANPGLASIEAALNPEDTDYLFFVADGTGGHVFAETLEEHNANVAEWRRLERERSAN